MKAVADAFTDFTFEGGNHPHDEMIRLAIYKSEGLTTPERTEINDALFKRLADEKKRHAHQSAHEMLRPGIINTLVYMLVEINMPLIKDILGRIKYKNHIKDSLDEMLAQALIGERSFSAEPAGVLGAILKYDYDKYGMTTFSTYMPIAIERAFIPKNKERKNAALVQSHYGIDPPKASWTAHEEDSPRHVAVNHDLMRVLESAIEKLPADYHTTAVLMLDSVARTGNLPSYREISAAQHPPVSPASAWRILNETMDALHDIIVRDFPQLSAEGVNGWREFRKAFKHSEERAK